MEETKIYHIDGKYRIQFEQAASTKGVIGFKVEANGDDIEQVRKEAHDLLAWAKEKAPNIGSEVK